MSVKAKVEALIDAAEEPVTLNQLTALLRDAVLAELRAEEEARLALNEVVSDGKPDVEEDEFADDEEEVVVDAVAAESLPDDVDGNVLSPDDLTPEQKAELDKEDTKREIVWGEHVS